MKFDVCIALPPFLGLEMTTLNLPITYLRSRNKGSAIGSEINTTRSLLEGRSVHNISSVSKEGGGHGYKKEEGAKSGLEPLPSWGQGDADEIHTQVASNHATLRPYAGTTDDCHRTRRDLHNYYRQTVVC